MNLHNRHIVVTGAGSGIGAAMAHRFHREGARVTLADVRGEKAQNVAQSIDGLAVECDVTCEAQVVELIRRAQQHSGEIDLFFSNAGIACGEPGHAASADNEVWQSNWEVHVMSHVYAARALLPSMIKRGSGYFLQMSSAAGLLCQIGDAAYSATKHAAVSFAESLAISHGDDGIAVSVVCPQYVATPLLGMESDSAVSAAIKNSRGLIATDVVADAVIEGVRKEAFLILPHPRVSQYIQHKSADYDEWLASMRSLRQYIVRESGGIDLQNMHPFIS